MYVNFLVEVDERYDSSVPRNCHWGCPQAPSSRGVPREPAALRVPGSASYDANRFRACPKSVVLRAVGVLPAIRPMHRSLLLWSLPTHSPVQHASERHQRDQLGRAGWSLHIEFDGPHSAGILLFDLACATQSPPQVQHQRVCVERRCCLAVLRSLCHCTAVP